MIGALLVVALAAPAHQVGVSRGLYTQTPDGVDLELVLARGEAARTVPGLDVDNSGSVDEREVAAGASAGLFARGVVDQVALDVDGKRCGGAFVGAGLTEEDGLAVRAHYACPAGVVHVDFRLAKSLSTGHRHLAHVVTTSGESDRVAFAGAPQFTFGDAAGGGSVLAALGGGVAAGFGPGHIAFLLGLVVVAGRRRSLAALVVAFLVADAAALALAQSGALALPAAIATTLAAVSVIYIGVENLFVVDVRGRFVVALAFGLVHGFTVALAAKTDAIPFAVGAICAHTVIIAGALALFSLARRRSLLTAGVTKAVSVVVVVSGAALLLVHALAAV